ncbi:MAG: FAD:protein FMN transferase [Burkholderiaceae bacterium]
MKRRAQPWLGTFVEIAIADAGDHGDVAFAQAFEAIALVHRLMSFHDPASDVSRINCARSGASLTVHPHTLQVLRLALAVGAATGGAFDIGCAPRLVACGQLPAPGAVPTAPVLCAADLLQPDEDDRVVKRGDGWIDLGGIAKGFAVDLAIDALRAAGVRRASVNAGGDLRVIGDTPWPVLIRSPENPTEAAACVLLRDKAMATSATYFSARRQNGASASALVDGRDGRAIAVAPSVSVFAPRCVLADALTKAVVAHCDPRLPALRQFGATALIVGEAPAGNDRPRI